MSRISLKKLDADGIESAVARMATTETDITPSKLAAWKAEHTPYEEVLRRVQCHGGPFAQFAHRDWLVTHYAWAIPNKEAIAWIADHSPICEIGAGNGYWAYRIAAAGGTIEAYDTGEWNKERTFLGVPVPTEPWYPVTRCPPSGFTAPADTTLFLCWPGYETAWATDALKAYEGEYVIYVGEDYGGCCADDAFHMELRKNWIEVDMLAIPQYGGINDRVYSYRRE